MKSDQTGVMLCGFGGQGIVFAGMILGQAAVIEGLNAAQATSYGAEARGSACRSEVIISRNKIIYPHIRKADILGVLNQQGYDKFISRLAPGGRVYYDSALVSVAEKRQYEHIGIPAMEKAVGELGVRIVANMIFLAAIVSRTGLINRESLKKAVRELVPARHLAVNLKALEIGFRL